MLLAIDVGNTQTVFGLFDRDRLTEQFRVGTNRTQTSDELAVMLRAFVDLESLEGIVLCSSVPQLVQEYLAFADRWAGVELLALG
jgi:type III pantothenate kinase